MDAIIEGSASSAFEALAPFYDSYTDDYEYEAWMANVEAVALRHGLRGKRLLDIGCGTGKSFMPLLWRGYEVTACDVSPSMVDRARRLSRGTGARLIVADARELPRFGIFDLVTSMDDALNYLLTDHDLATAFEGAARNLRPGGLFVFDLNTIGGYRRYFPSDSAREMGGAFFCWRGEASADPVAPGGVFNSVIEIFSTDDGDCWHRTSSRHVQRHHPPELVVRLLRRAGFDLVDCRGQTSGGRLDSPADEEACTKLDYFARRRGDGASNGDETEVSDMTWRP